MKTAVVQIYVDLKGYSNPEWLPEYDELSKISFDLTKKYCQKINAEYFLILNNSIYFFEFISIKCQNELASFFFSFTLKCFSKSEKRTNKTLFKLGLVNRFFKLEPAYEAGLILKPLYPGLTFGTEAGLPKSI